MQEQSFILAVAVVELVLATNMTVERKEEMAGREALNCPVE